VVVVVVGGTVVVVVGGGGGDVVGGDVGGGLVTGGLVGDELDGDGLDGDELDDAGLEWFEGVGVGSVVVEEDPFGPGFSWDVEGTVAIGEALLRFARSSVPFVWTVNHLLATPCPFA
jgi:hypothetical protein